MRTWRFVDTGASPASLNMAIDQAMLEMHASGKSSPTLRIYQWSPPAISLGYFQRRHGIDLAACQRLGIDVVRRPTGGRAVLHFEDVTYAIVAGTVDGIPSSAAAAYHLIYQGLLAAFRTLGFEAELGRNGEKLLPSDMCFLTSTAGDILHEGKKFVGSAQAWHGSSMLQHGSIILEPHIEVWTNLQGDGHVSSPNYEEMIKRRMTSVREILGCVPGREKIGAAIQQGMSQVLGVEFNEDGLTPEEWGIARKISDELDEEELCLDKNLPGCQPVSSGPALQTTSNGSHIVLRQSDNGKTLLRQGRRKDDKETDFA
ncbi:MAG: biotin/lipoate A/B protein ligase family protein [Dehalococcoidia bacterium]|nr:biotin/lipoate A/B protein ligase family protein [Dehalococcoidia bacterium]